jgi:hypothetical protein
VKLRQQDKLEQEPREVATEPSAVGKTGEEGGASCKEEWEDCVRIQLHIQFVALSVAGASTSEEGKHGNLIGWCIGL